MATELLGNSHFCLLFLCRAAAATINQPKAQRECQTTWKVQNTCTGWAWTNKCPSNQSVFALEIKMIRCYCSMQSYSKCEKQNQIYFCCYTGKHKTNNQHGSSLTINYSSALTPYWSWSKKCNRSLILRDNLASPGIILHLSYRAISVRAQEDWQDCRGGVILGHYQFIYAPPRLKEDAVDIPAWLDHAVFLEIL